MALHIKIIFKKNLIIRGEIIYKQTNKQTKTPGGDGFKSREGFYTFISFIIFYLNAFKKNQPNTNVRNVPIYGSANSGRWLV